MSFNFKMDDARMILPALAAFSVVLLIIQKLYCMIRRKFPVNVNCWFCNSNTSVPYNSSNAWYCPQCDQYNGFYADGSYNRLLTEQFNEKLNHRSWCTKTKPKIETTNGLCRFCNINLELKIQQLAHFVPLNKANYDEEVQQYSNQLERVYRLCSRCQGVLERTLNDKQEQFVTNQPKTFSNKLDYSNLQPKKNERHTLCLGLTSILSMGLLLSVLPYHWTVHIVKMYPPPDYIIQVLSFAQEYLKYLPKEIQSSVFLILGAVVQLFDWAYMRNTTSFVNLLLWIILLTLTNVPVQVDGLVSIVHMLASIVFLITSVTERWSGLTKNVSPINPVEIKKLDGKSKTTETKLDTNVPADTNPVNKLSPLKSPVSDSNPIRPSSSPSHEPTSEDFGFSKLSVSPRRETRSQTKPFQAKLYGSQVQMDLFKPNFNLTPPKLQIDKTSEYQVPLTRSSSQSSGFVSLSHQKDFEEIRLPSVYPDDIESISQCGRALTPYHPPFIPPTSMSHSYGMPFSHFPPYTLMHFPPSHFNKFYPYSNMSLYDTSLNLSTFSINRSVEKEGRFQQLKNILSSLLFLFLIGSNTAVLWKVFGEEYFKNKL